MYSIDFTDIAVEHLESLKPFDCNRILDEIEKQLGKEPSRKMRRKKMLQGIKAPWLHVQPVWQLRIDDYRVFYDVDEPGKVVTILAILFKGRKTTGELL